MTGRHHALSLLVSALALALGLGLGAGPVSDRSTTQSATDRARLQTKVDRLEAKVTALDAQAATDSDVVTALAAPLVGDRLSGRTVVLVATPGADKAAVKRIGSTLTDAGATVTGTLTLRPAYVDPANAQSPLEDLALKLVPPDVTFPVGARPIERVGTVLARSIVQRPDDGQPPESKLDRKAAEAIAGLDELGALRLAGDPGERAELAVMVSGTEDKEDKDAPEALTGLAVALRAGSRGTVVVGPGDATKGPLRWVRDGRGRGLSEISTVDGVSSTAGRLALVLALAEQVDGASGAYGTGRRADAVIPVPEAAPTG